MGKKVARLPCPTKMRFNVRTLQCSLLHYSDLDLWPGTFPLHFHLNNEMVLSFLKVSAIESMHKRGELDNFLPSYGQEGCDQSSRLGWRKHILYVDPSIHVWSVYLPA